MPSGAIDTATSSVCVAPSYSPYLGIQVNVPASLFDAISQSRDSIQMAAELGRLDFVAAILACIGIIIAVFGFIGFWTLRPAVARAAKVAAAEEIKALLPVNLTPACLETLQKRPDLIVAALRHDPSLLLSVLSEAKEALFGDIDDKEAQNIAEKIGGDTGK